MSASTDPQTNSRGIPVAPFVDEVEKYVDSREDIERNLKKFQEMIAKYQFMEANVMLSYPIDEATTLLKGKLEAAKESLCNCEEDMDFLRQQITTLEVNTARLYNYEVTLKRKEREEAEREEKERKGGA